MSARDVILDNHLVSFQSAQGQQRFCFGPSLTIHHSIFFNAQHILTWTRDSEELTKRLLVTDTPLPHATPNLTTSAPDCKNDKTSLIRIDLIDESPFHLKGSFPGPQGTPYEGGTFDVVSGALV